MRISGMTLLLALILLLAVLGHGAMLVDSVRTGASWRCTMMTRFGCTAWQREGGGDDVTPTP